MRPRTLNTHGQALWLEYLNSFNLSLQFCPGRLGAKPDALTRRWDVYPKGEGTPYADANPENVCLLFARDHITRASADIRHAATNTSTTTPSPAEPLSPVTNIPPGDFTSLLDIEALRSDILEGLNADTDAQTHICEIRKHSTSEGKWSLSPTGFLLHE